jgi:hypothetical protein
MGLGRIRLSYKEAGRLHRLMTCRPLQNLLQSGIAMQPLVTRQPPFVHAQDMKSESPSEPPAGNPSPASRFATPPPLLLNDPLEAPNLDVGGIPPALLDPTTFSSLPPPLPGLPYMLHAPAGPSGEPPAPLVPSTSGRDDSVPQAPQEVPQEVPPGRGARGREGADAEDGRAQKRVRGGGGGGAGVARHIVTEQQRRDREKAGFAELRKLIPLDEKLDKASFLKKVVEYIAQLQVGRLFCHWSRCMCSELPPPFYIFCLHSESPLPFSNELLVNTLVRMGDKGGGEGKTMQLCKSWNCWGPAQGVELENVTTFGSSLHPFTVREVLNEVVPLKRMMGCIGGAEVSLSACRQGWPGVVRTEMPG